MNTLSHYTGGNSGWGTMVCTCADCGAVVAEYECDEDGIPMETIFDCADSHQCE